MLTRESLEHGVPFKGASVVWFCFECGEQLRSCCDPACETVMHHIGDYGCPQERFDVPIADLTGYVIFDYKTRAEAIAEVEGYEEYTRLMYRYWGVD
jgi:hypothetical protein